MQILTIDEISLLILKDENLRQAMLQTLSKCIDELIESDFSESNQIQLTHILYHFRYMTRANTLKYAVESTDMIEQMLTQAARLYYHDKIEFRTEHILYDQSLFKEGLYNIDIFIIKIFKSFVKAIDFNNVERN